MRLRRKLRRLARGLLGQADPVILMYHRVAEPAVDPWGLAVSPENFMAQMRVLKRMRQPVPLDWMVEQLLAGRRPKGAVAITFDDAYRDVLRNAKPALTALDIPATVFVVTGKLGSANGFWWDRLAAAVLSGGQYQGRLSFLAGDEQQDVDAAQASGNAEAVHLKLWKLIRVLGPQRREEAVEEVAAAFGPRLREDAPVMNHDEIAELMDGGLIGIGAHTVTHPSLPSLSAEEQRDEIGRSRDALERLTGQPVRRLAYPFGDFDERSETIARELGFDYAVSVEPGAVNDPAARYRLPRHDIKNWTGAEFGKRLRWLN